MRYLAIDYGNKRTGLAICDSGETIASPLAVIEGQKQLLTAILQILRDEQVEAVVVGLPLNMDGSEGPQAQVVRKFADRLKNHVKIPVQFQDERLSSFGARDKLAPADFTRRKKNKRLDAVAAAEILDAFLGAKREQ